MLFFQVAPTFWFIASKVIGTTKPKSSSKDSAISHWLPFAAALMAAPKPELFGVIQVPRMEVRKPM